MLATVDDIHHWHRHLVLLRPRAVRLDIANHKVRLLELSQVLIKLKAKGRSARPCHTHGHSKDSVGAKLRLWVTPLILRPVELVDHELVELLLVTHIPALELRRDDAVNVVHGLGDALALVALATVAQLQCLVDAGGGATGHGGGEAAITGAQCGLHCGVATAVQHLAAHEADDPRRVVCRQLVTVALALPREDARETRQMPECQAANEQAGMQEGPPLRSGAHHRDGWGLSDLRGS
mmetsp:Transcript_86492/g.201273  ORF Transcript_86492/g.201273 Transcript_86492/m.201273 type:complete len:237 (+) Transcript_86492:973-1683(+)